MGLLDTLGKIADNTPAGLITRGVSAVLDRILPEDPATRDAAAIHIMELQAQGTFEQKAELQTQTAQIAVEAAAAAQPGAHFRDGAGWTCVAGFALVILKPVIEWGAVLAGHPVTLPAVDKEATSTMLYALLGLGAYHAAPAVLGAVRGGA